MDDLKAMDGQIEKKYDCNGCPMSHHFMVDRNKVPLTKRCPYCGRKMSLPELKKRKGFR